MFPEADELTDSNSIEFIGKLSVITKHTRERCSAMLGWLGKLGTKKEDALRIAYAVIGYLPCFDSQDRTLETAYDGRPVFDVHGRFMAAHGFIDSRSNKPYVDCAFIAMSTILAGRVYLFRFNIYQIDRLLKKLYIGRTKLEKNPHPAELSGCYAVLPSSWLAGEIGKVNEVKCTSEMRELNRALCKKRAVRKCDVAESCAKCYKGRDECAIAVRLHTRKKKKEENVYNGE